MILFGKYVESFQELNNLALVENLKEQNNLQKLKIFERSDDMVKSKQGSAVCNH